MRYIEQPNPNGDDWTEIIGEITQEGITFKVIKTVRNEFLNWEGYKENSSLRDCIKELISRELLILYNKERNKYLINGKPVEFFISINNVYADIKARIIKDGTIYSLFETAYFNQSIEDKNKVIQIYKSSIFEKLKQWDRLQNEKQLETS